MKLTITFDAMRRRLDERARAGHEPDAQAGPLLAARGKGTPLEALAHQRSRRFHRYEPKWNFAVIKIYDFPRGARCEQRL